jgi:hypothetical protein
MSIRESKNLLLEEVNRIGPKIEEIDELSL